MNVVQLTCIDIKTSKWKKLLVDNTCSKMAYAMATFLGWWLLRDVGMKTLNQLIEKLRWFFLHWQFHSLPKSLFSCEMSAGFKFPFSQWNKYKTDASPYRTLHVHCTCTSLINCSSLLFLGVFIFHMWQGSHRSGSGQQKRIPQV